MCKNAFNIFIQIIDNNIEQNIEQNKDEDITVAFHYRSFF